MKDVIIIYQADKAASPIENLIFTVREQQVMLDFHLAQLHESMIKPMN